MDIDFITGGLDEYPVTADVAAKYLKDKDLDLIVVFGVPHAFPIEEFDIESVAVTDGPRLVEPLKDLSYTHVVAELDAPRPASPAPWPATRARTCPEPRGELRPFPPA